MNPADTPRSQETPRSPRARPHLSEFELDEALLGAATPAMAAHLAECSQCAARRDAVAQPIAGFQAVSLAWAEQRSAAMPLPGHLPGHLTDDQLDEVMIAGASSASAAHLAWCAPCGERLEALAQPIASFREVALAWSERRSATLPLRAAGARTSNWTVRHGWVAATAMLVVLMLFVPGHLADRKAGNHGATNAGNAADASVPGQGAAPQNPATQNPAAQNSAGGTMQAAVVTGPAAPLSAEELRRQQQIAADNQMLAAIDAELDHSQATLAAFGVEVSGPRSHPRSHGLTGLTGEAGSGRIVRE